MYSFQNEINFDIKSEIDDVLLLKSEVMDTTDTNLINDKPRCIFIKFKTQNHERNIFYNSLSPKIEENDLENIVDKPKNILAKFSDPKLQMNASVLLERLNFNTKNIFSRTCETMSATSRKLRNTKMKSQTKNGLQSTTDNPLVFNINISAFRDVDDKQLICRPSSGPPTYKLLGIDRNYSFCDDSCDSDLDNYLNENAASLHTFRAPDYIPVLEETDKTEKNQGHVVKNMNNLEIDKTKYQQNYDGVNDDNVPNQLNHPVNSSVKKTPHSVKRKIPFAEYQKKRLRTTVAEYPKPINVETNESTVKNSTENQIKDTKKINKVNNKMKSGNVRKSSRTTSKGKRTTSLSVQTDASLASDAEGANNNLDNENGRNFVSSEDSNQCSTPLPNSNGLQSDSELLTQSQSTIYKNQSNFRSITKTIINETAKQQTRTNSTQISLRSHDSRQEYLNEFETNVSNKSFKSKQSTIQRTNSILKSPGAQDIQQEYSSDFDTNVANKSLKSQQSRTNSILKSPGAQDIQQELLRDFETNVANKSLKSQQSRTNSILKSPGAQDIQQELLRDFEKNVANKSLKSQQSRTYSILKSPGAQDIQQELLRDFEKNVANKSLKSQQSRTNSILKSPGAQDIQQEYSSDFETNVANKSFKRQQSRTNSILKSPGAQDIQQEYSSDFETNVANKSFECQQSRTNSTQISPESHDIRQEYLSDFETNVSDESFNYQQSRTNSTQTLPGSRDIQQEYLSDFETNVSDKSFKYQQSQTEPILKSPDEHDIQQNYSSDFETNVSNKSFKCQESQTLLISPDPHDLSPQFCYKSNKSKKKIKLWRHCLNSSSLLKNSRKRYKICSNIFDEFLPKYTSEHPLFVNRSVLGTSEIDFNDHEVNMDTKPVVNLNPVRNSFKVPCTSTLPSTKPLGAKKITDLREVISSKSSNVRDLPDENTKRYSTTFEIKRPPQRALQRNESCPSFRTSSQPQILQQNENCSSFRTPSQPRILQRNENCATFRTQSPPRTLQRNENCATFRTQSPPRTLQRNENCATFRTSTPPIINDVPSTQIEDDVLSIFADSVIVNSPNSPTFDSSDDEINDGFSPPNSPPCNEEFEEILNENDNIESSSNNFWNTKDVTVSCDKNLTNLSNEIDNQLNEEINEPENLRISVKNDANRHVSYNLNNSRTVQDKTVQDYESKMKSPRAMNDNNIDNNEIQMITPSPKSKKPFVPTNDRNMKSFVYESPTKSPLKNTPLVTSMPQSSRIIDDSNTQMNKIQSSPKIRQFPSISATTSSTPRQSSFLINHNRDTLKFDDRLVEGTSISINQKIGESNDNQTTVNNDDIESVTIPNISSISNNISENLTSNRIPTICTPRKNSSLISTTHPPVPETITDKFEITHNSTSTADHSNSNSDDNFNVKIFKKQLRNVCGHYLEHGFCGNGDDLKHKLKHKLPSDLEKFVQMFTHQQLLDIYENVVCVYRFATEELMPLFAKYYGKYDDQLNLMEMAKKLVSLKPSVNFKRMVPIMESIVNALANFLPKSIAIEKIFEAVGQNQFNVIDVLLTLALREFTIENNWSIIQKLTSVENYEIPLKDVECILNKCNYTRKFHVQTVYDDVIKKVPDINLSKINPTLLNKFISAMKTHGIAGTEELEKRLKECQQKYGITKSPLPTNPFNISPVSLPSTSFPNNYSPPIKSLFELPTRIPIQLHNSSPNISSNNFIIQNSPQCHDCNSEKKYPVYKNFKPRFNSSYDGTKNFHRSRYNNREYQNRYNNMKQIISRITQTLCAGDLEQGMKLLHEQSCRPDFKTMIEKIIINIPPHLTSFVTRFVSDKDRQQPKLDGPK